MADLPGTIHTAGMNEQPPNLVRYRVAHVSLKGADLIFVPLDATICQRSIAEQSGLLRTLQCSADAAGIKGTVVLVWDKGGGKTGVLAEKTVYPHIQGTTLASVHSNINRELTVRGLTASYSSLSPARPNTSGASACATGPARTDSGPTQLESAPPRASEIRAPNSTPLIPDHELIRSIGEGGYGEVWLARDVIGTYHAVKIVYRQKFSNAKPYEREFRGMRKFTPISRTHPGLIHILHVGRNDRDGYFFYIMELGDDEVSAQEINPCVYSARNLAKELSRDRKWPGRRCLELGAALTSALHHLHRHQLIHRDIKPSNIIFVHGVPKLADIGLVTELGGKGTDVTFIGTEGYIPPEGPGTAAGDIYSLGKLLYEASMGKDRNQFPELPTSLADRIDRDLLMQLKKIIFKACEPNIQARYQSAGEMHDDLRRLQASSVSVVT